MAYPLIILGAGASYDSLDETQYNLNSGELYNFRPPLTNGIFELSRFGSFINKQAEISSLATFINSRVPRRMTFEEALYDVEANIVSSNEDRYKWLIAVRFYIADLFNEISKRYSQKVNNYGYIIDRLNDYCSGCGIIVNFNYDLLLECNIPSIIDATDITSYISSRIKVIKIHGACNWSVFAKSITSPNGGIQAYPFFIEHAPAICRQVIEKPHYIINPPGWNYTQNVRSFQQNVYLPAVAIPIAKKSGIYVCPESHITSLTEELRKIDRILIIGWKAGDSFLLDLIKSSLPKPTQTWVVNKNANQENINKRYSSIPNLHINGIFSDGFNQFILDGRIDDFLRAPSMNIMS